MAESCITCTHIIHDDSAVRIASTQHTHQPQGHAHRRWPLTYSAVSAPRRLGIQNADRTKPEGRALLNSNIGHQLGPIGARDPSGTESYSGQLDPDYSAAGDGALSCSAAGKRAAWDRRARGAHAALFSSSVSHNALTHLARNSLACANDA
jgi:hypothetical protein